jgi:RNA polymerase subunit RPABC4/transcription elongation factor Spt4
MKTEYIPAGISVERQCLDCTADVLCTDCVETKESRDWFIMYQIVDEGNMGYSAPQVQIENELPSGHDWTERDEFLEPTSLISDRIFDTDPDIHQFEKVCSTCHLVVNREVGCTACLPEVLQEFVQSQARYYFNMWNLSLN